MLQKAPKKFTSATDNLSTSANKENLVQATKTELIEEKQQAIPNAASVSEDISDAVKVSDERK